MPEIGWSEGRIRAARSIGTRREHLTTYLTTYCREGLGGSARVDRATRERESAFYEGSWGSPADYR